MSLLDTIKGARKEAEAAGTLPAGAGRQAAEAAAGEAGEEAGSVGFSKRSAARAKPTREAASSVRVSGSAADKANMSKEEKKAERDKRRTEEDLVYDAKTAVLNANPGYERSQRIWWVVVGVGLVLTIISFFLGRSIDAESANASTQAIVSIVMMVLAYVLVIGAVIYDFVKVRPLRKAAEAEVAGMTRKRMRKAVEDEAARKAAKKAGKSK